MRVEAASRLGFEAVAKLDGSNASRSRLFACSRLGRAARDEQHRRLRAGRLHAARNQFALDQRLEDLLALALRQELRLPDQRVPADLAGAADDLQDALVLRLGVVVRDAAVGLAQQRADAVFDQSPPT